MKYIRNINEFMNQKTLFTVYHRSNSNNHLEKLNFEKADSEDSVFGQAIYFSSSSDTTSQLGHYMGKYEIVLDNPLNLNIEFSPNRANELMNIFIKKYDIEDDEYDFNNEYDVVSYGNLFLEIQEFSWGESSKYIHDFITSYLGFNSFYHYSDYGTNFIDDFGDYGFCYGVYNENDIKFIDFAN